MFWILKEANAIVQSKDFDDDGESELLGVRVAAITILTVKGLIISYYNKTVLT